MMHFAKGQGTHKWAAVSFITNAAQVTFCCVIINLSDRISLVTMLLCLLLSTFYAKIQGSLKYVNGYIGDWKESTQHGYGTCTRANGDVYVGEWKAGKPHGHGTYKYVDGDVYVGDLKDCKRHGHGTFKGANGDVYVGEWKENKPHGHGTYKWDNGDVYVGERKDGKSHGHGTYEYANGDVYVGERKDDKRHGHGTYKWADGDTHTGEWKADKRHGFGTYKYASNGDEYSGYWEHGERCGEFLLLPTSKIDDPEREILENQRECSICLEEFRRGDERTLLPCNHGFHTRCVNTWFSSESSCPVCRRSVG